MFTIHLCGELLPAFWKFYDPSHPEYRPAQTLFGSRDPLLEVLVAIDAILGEIIELAGPRGLVLYLGAFGHRLEHTRVHLNALLEREGCLFGGWRHHGTQDARAGLAGAR
jgi:hypothetical protein